MLMGLPDSMDMVSLWDNSSNLSQGKIEDLRMVQQKKGTKVLMCTFIQYVGKGFTPAEYDVDEATREAFWGWKEVQKLDEEGNPMFDKQGNPIMVPEENAMKASLEKYAQAIADTIYKYGYDGLDIDFEVRVIPDIDESYPDSIDSMEIPLYIARSKAEAYKSTMADDELLITADTIVWTFDGVMGKPANREEAYAMLHALSDHVHQVITGVCIMTKDKNVGFSVESAVCFAKLGDEEINYYLDKYKPYDKAGGYGIQEWIGYIGVEAINGSFYNVMGLPVQKLYQELKHF